MSGCDWPDWLIMRGIYYENDLHRITYDWHDLVTMRGSTRKMVCTLHRISSEYKYRVTFLLTSLSIIFQKEILKLMMLCLL